jgi:hypothetical protein
MDGLIRNENGTFAAGTAPGPGRPKGQSLKEYWRQRFADMTDEEKAEFTKKVGVDTIWKMAEGNPATATDVTSGGEKLTINLVQFGDNDSPQSEAGAD